MGPNSIHLKFSNHLCSDCNNNKTHYMDRDYDTFMEYVLSNENKVRTDGIALKELWGKAWTNKIINVYRYISKHISCYLAEAQVVIPKESKAFILNEVAYCPFFIKFIYSLEYEKWRSIAGQLPSVSIGGLERRESNSVQTYNSYYANQWFTIGWIYTVGTPLLYNPAISDTIFLHPLKFNHFEMLSKE